MLVNDSHYNILFQINAGRTKEILQNQTNAEVTFKNNSRFCYLHRVLFENLYDKVHVSENRSLHDILGDNEDKLSDDAAQTLDGKITHIALLHALKHMKNEKKVLV